MLPRGARVINRECPHNLPAQVTTFVGRRAEIDAIVNLLSGAPPVTRLVTLTGTGGVGKTRLAHEAATHLLRSGQFPDGVWLVELAPLANPRRLAQVVASVLDLQEAPGHPFDAVLVDALRLRQLLLVLDNCEHLVDACADLVHTLLRACPRVAILATSREPLKTPGEAARRVPSLERPDPLDLPAVSRLCTFEAVHLFAERAAAVSSSFEVTADNAAAVARVCVQLDGIPLALELAAARVSALSVEQIAARLDDRFRLLANGNRTLPRRQQTLEAAVSWSYDLLGEDERRLFNRLAIFAGGWTLEAAEAICSHPDGASVLDVLTRLVEKSLVMAEDGPTSATRWYRLQETIRQFGAQRLAASGELDVIHERHFQWYVQFAIRAGDSLRFGRIPWSKRVVWLEYLRWDIANLRTAWQWAIHGQGSPRDGLRLGGALFAFFWSGYLLEGRDVLLELLDRDRGSGPSQARAWALAMAAKLVVQYGDQPTAVALCDEYLALPEQLWSDIATAFIMNTLGLVALRQGDLARAREHITRGISLARTGGDTQAVPLYLMYLAAVDSAAGDVGAAERLYRQAIAIAENDDFPPAIGLALGGLARLVQAGGDRAQALALYERALIALRDMAAMPQLAVLLADIGNLELTGGASARAGARFAESLQLGFALGLRDVIATSLEGIACVVLGQGPDAPSRLQPVLQLLGAAGRLRDVHGLSAAPEAVQQASRHATALLGSALAEAELTSGRGLPLEQAAALARVLVAGRHMHPVTAEQADLAAVGLTRREREVAELLVVGSTNRQIGQVLVIAERTAEMHVSNLLAKLGLDSRAEVAVWAAAHGLTPRARTVKQAAQ
jgi:predicted ATPase/DNA-binding CsgD family transcriptional regulator